MIKSLGIESRLPRIYYFIIAILIMLGMDFVEVCHISDFIASHSDSADSVTIHSIGVLLGLPANVYTPLICIECIVLTAKVNAYARLCIHSV